MHASENENEVPAAEKSTLRSKVRSRLFGQGIFTLADQMVASLTTFLTGALVGRMCLEEEFGFYILGFSLFTLLLTLQNSVITTPFQIYFPRTTEDTEKGFVGGFLVQQMALGLSAGLLILCGALYSWLVLDNPGIARMLAVLAIAIEFMLLRDFIRQIFFAHLSGRGVFVFDVAIAVAQFLGLGLLGYSGALNGALAYLALGVSSCVGACGWYALSGRSLDLRIKSAVDQFRSHWSTVKWLLASGLLWSISINLYAWLLAGFHGAASAGAWGAALGVVTIINPLSIGAQNYLAPRIARAYAEHGIDALNRVLAWSTAVYAGGLTLFSAIMLVLGEPLVVAIYGEKYAGNGLIVAILAFNFALNAAGFTVSRGLFTLERARIDFHVNLAALAAMLCVGLWLAKYYGPVGAAAGQVASNLVACLIRTAAYVACQRGVRAECRA